MERKKYTLVQVPRTPSPTYEWVHPGRGRSEAPPLQLNSAVSAAATQRANSMAGFGTAPEQVPWWSFQGTTQRDISAPVSHQSSIVQQPSALNHFLSAAGPAHPFPSLSLQPDLTRIESGRSWITARHGSVVHSDDPRLAGTNSVMGRTSTLQHQHTASQVGELPRCSISTRRRR